MPPLDQEPLRSAGEAEEYAERGRCHVHQKVCGPSQLRIMREGNNKPVGLASRLSRLEETTIQRAVGENCKSKSDFHFLINF